MNPSSAGSFDESASGRSLEDARRRFLAACELSVPGGPPPNVESFVADLPEPQRSQLRNELQSAERSYQQCTAPTVNLEGAVTKDNRQSDATEELSASGSESANGAAGPVSMEASCAPPGVTLEHVSGFPDKTAMRDVTEGGTEAYTPHAPQRPQAGARRRAIDHPREVAGYEILGVLGRGAMGVVYKARQRGLKRLVALKMILSGDHASEHELARFRSEAEAVAHLQHPNIVQIYEIGEEQNRPFFSLEFVDGPSLHNKLKGTPLPPAEAAQLVEKLAGAMHYAHEHGIIHRDLKPANVLLASDGTPKIGDFGLAKRIEEDAGQTRTGAVLGTPSYMAPEQAEGRTKEVGPLSDQYSLGAILYEMLTGRPPFKGSTVLDTLQQVRTLEPVPPVEFQPGMPPDLETICLKALQKEPVRRYASAGALAEDLHRFLAGEPILARPVSRAERLWRWCRRNPSIAGLTAAVVGLVLVWGVTSTALALGLKVQKDKTEAARLAALDNEAEARRQEGIARQQKQEADKNAEQARRQEEIAHQKKIEADRNAEIAKNNQELAQRQTAIAKKNETRAKNTAQLTVAQMIELGRKLHRSLSAQDAPEVRRLRDDVLVLLRESLVTMSKGVQELGITNFGQAFSYQQLGDLLANLGAKQEALKAYQHSYDLIKRVVDAEPDNDLARGNLGVMLLRLGDVALDLQGDAWEGLARYTKARDLHEEILRRPRSGYFKELAAKRILSHDETALGRAHVALGQSADAKKHLALSLKLRQEWSTAEPENVAAKSYCTESRLWLGIAASRLGDERTAREHFTEALRVNEDLVRTYPKSFSFKTDLAEIQGAWGDALLRMGKTEEADKLFRESLANLQRVIDNDPDDLSAKQGLALAQARLGAVSSARGQTAAARKHYQEALKHENALLQLEPANLTRQAAHVLALARAGKYAESAAEAAKVRQRVAKSPKLLLEIVRAHALCAAGSSAGKAEYVKQALVALRAATEKNYRDVVVLLTDRELEVLRGEAGFRQMIEALKAG